MSDDPIERLRAHLNEHRGHSLFVSRAGLTLLFKQRDELKAQNERLIAKEGKRISDVLGDQRKGVELRREQGGD